MLGRGSWDDKMPKTGQHGKMFPLFQRDSLLLFSRKKTFYKGGVMLDKGPGMTRRDPSRTVRLETGGLRTISHGLME